MTRRFTDTFSSNGITINAINSTATGLLANSSQMSFGNSTVNVTMTCGTLTMGGGLITNTPGLYLSTSGLQFGNATVNTTVNSTAFTGTANNSAYLGGVAAATYVNTSGAYVITGAHTYGNLTVNSVINSTAHTIGAANSTASGLVINTTALMLGNNTVNATINSTTFSGISLTANNATNLGGVAAATYVQTGSFNVVNTASNGSFNMPGGWHMAFGLLQTNTQGGLAVTFANAFTQNAYSVTATVTDTGTSFAATVVDRVHIGTVTKTGFTMWTGNSSANAQANVYFKAIGF